MSDSADKLPTPSMDADDISNAAAAIQKTAGALRATTEPSEALDLSRDLVHVTDQAVLRQMGLLRSSAKQLSANEREAIQVLVRKLAELLDADLTL